MNFERYDVEKSSHNLVFEFTSNGSKGSIKKVVKFEKIPGSDFFNLAFGDAGSLDDEIDDLIISNNNDTDKVLNTVAFIVTEFLRLFPNSLVYATGSTLSRTRLYQIGISKNLMQIETEFEIFGLIGLKYEKFEKGKQYEAFVIRKKVF